MQGVRQMMVRQDFNRRHSPNRRKTLFEVTIEADGESVTACIVDVSYEGLKLSVPKPLPQGTALSLHLPGGRIPALVHWYRDGFIGAHLLQRLERDVLITLETADDDLADFR